MTEAEVKYAATGGSMSVHRLKTKSFIKLKIKQSHNTSMEAQRGEDV
jgi:hypothetical protein